MPTERIKICFVLNSPRLGGAEKRILALVRNIDRSRFAVSLIFFNAAGEYARFIPDGIEVKNLAFSSPVPNPIWIWRLARAFQTLAPHVIFSGMGYPNLMSLLAHQVSRIPAAVVINEGSVLREHLLGDPWSAVKKALCRWLYPKAARIIFPTQAVWEDLENFLKITFSQGLVIPNFIDDKHIAAMLDEPDGPFSPTSPGRKIVISVARLERVKDMELALKALTELQKSLRCEYWILGTGEEEGRLKILVKELGLTETVKFLGFQENPYHYLKKADVFLLTSRSEAFPCALLEAMFCHKPCVVSYFNGSVADIIRQDVDGIIVKERSAEKFAGALQRVLSDEASAQRLGASAGKAVEKYLASKIVRQYEDLFLKIKSGNA
mgnify:FL=1